MSVTVTGPVKPVNRSIFSGGKEMRPTLAKVLGQGSKQEALTALRQVAVAVYRGLLAAPPLLSSAALSGFPSLMAWEMDAYPGREHLPMPLLYYSLQQPNDVFSRRVVATTF